MSNLTNRTIKILNKFIYPLKDSVAATFLPNELIPNNILISYPQIFLSHLLETFPSSINTIPIYLELQFFKFPIMLNNYLHTIPTYPLCFIRLRYMVIDLLDRFNWVILLWGLTVIFLWFGLIWKSFFGWVVVVVAVLSCVVFPSFSPPIFSGSEALLIAPVSLEILEGTHCSGSSTSTLSTYVVSSTPTSGMLHNS